MCDRIHVDQQVDGLSVLVELVQYPSQLDGSAGNRLATILSEIASYPVPPGSNLRNLVNTLEVAAFPIRGLVSEIGWMRPDAAMNQALEARGKCIQIAGAALALAVALENFHPEPTANPSTDAEVLLWLRRRIGELMGRTGEAAIAAATPRMRVAALLCVPVMEELESAIRTRWGCELVLDQGSTIANVAAAITAAQAGRTAA